MLDEQGNQFQRMCDVWARIEVGLDKLEKDNEVNDSLYKMFKHLHLASVANQMTSAMVETLLDEIAMARANSAILRPYDWVLLAEIPERVGLATHLVNCVCRLAPAVMGNNRSGDYLWTARSALCIIVFLTCQ